MTAPDYYEVLGVPREADAKAIKDAFRELTFRYHPDRNKAPEAAEKYRQIVEAYSVLSDAEKRKAYDTRGFADVAGISTEDLLGGIDFADLFGDGLLGDFFGRRSRSRPMRGEDLQLSVGVSLERVLSGGEEQVHATRPMKCADCHGSGAAVGTAPKPCTACSGSGRHVESREQGKGVLLRQITRCASCNGRGTIIERPCAKCSGRGETETEEKLTVKVPPGAEEGMVLRVAGHGLPSPDRAGSPGDLLIVLYTLPDERFVRRGANLHTVKTLSVPDAVLGTTFEQPTLEKPLATKVPPGTQPGSILRLRHQGLPHFGSSERGDLFVQIDVHVPEHLTPETEALYTRLRNAGGS